ncbi:MAG: DUF3313 family protein [Victivallaceae bacterium]
MRKLLFGFGTAALLALLVSCAVKEDQKTVFIEDAARMKPDDRVPVKRIWKDPSVSMAHYNKIIIKDVRTDLQLDKSWMEHNGGRAIIGEEDNDLKELAAYMKKTFSAAIQDDKCRMKLADKPGPDTVILELAIVKVVANKPLLEAGSTVGMAIFKPISLCLIPVKSMISTETHSPLCAYIAIEGKILDSQTGRELIVFTLSGSEDSALFDANKYTSTYANVREIINRWSVKLVEAINNRPLETDNSVPLDDPSGYSLLKL